MIVLLLALIVGSVGGALLVIGVTVRELARKRLQRERLARWQLEILYRCADPVPVLNDAVQALAVRRFPQLSFWES